MAAPVWLGRGRRVVRGIDLHLFSRSDAISALAIARLAANRAAAQLMSRNMLALYRIALACLGGAVWSGGAIAAGLLAAGAIAAGSIGEVPAGITQLIASQRLPSSAVSFVVLDAESGRMVMSHNPDTPRSPASTIKTVTTFAALDMLGPTFLWQTRAWMRDGDLYLQ